MAEYILCYRCGKYGIELLNDEETGCIYCLNEDEDDSYEREIEDE